MKDLEPTKARELLERLRKAGKPLGEYVKGRFYSGIKTGLNEAFVVDRKNRDRLIAEHPSSAEVLKPFLRGKDVKRWRAAFAEQYLIKIESSENKQHPWSGKPEKRAERIFAQTYPAVYTWLGPFRDRLIKRNDQGKYFWELRSCKYWREFERSKLVFPAIAHDVEYAPDTESHFSNDKTSICVSDDIVYLLCLLNSNVLWWFIRQIAAAKQGGLYEFKPMYALQVPVSGILSKEKRVFNMLGNYVIYLKQQDFNQCSDLSHAPDRLMLSYFEQIINGMVCELYFPEELHRENKYFTGLIQQENLPPLERIRSDKMGALREIFTRLFDNKHPVRKNLFFLDTLEVIRIIEGKQ